MINDPINTIINDHYLIKSVFENKYINRAEQKWDNLVSLTDYNDELIRSLNSMSFKTHTTVDILELIFAIGTIPSRIYNSVEELNN